MGLQHSPRIVTDGLVLCLDAADKNSYPGSGNTWTDLSGNGYGGSLQNTPAFDDEDMGTLSFDGVNEYINLPNNPFDLTVGSHTFEMWALAHSWTNESSNCNDKRTYPLTIHSGANNFIGFVTDSSNRFEFQRRDPGVNYFLGPSSSQQQLNVWYHLVGILENPGAKMYVNSSLVSSSSTAKATENPTTFKIGYNTFNCTNPYFNGKISGIKIYNRALTPQEIQQNYNATKTRFGL